MSAPRTDPAKGAYFGLGVLTLVNLLNYLDRYIVAGVVPRVQEELGINNTQAGALGTVFVVVYMVASPLGGYLGDRIQRRYVVAGSVFLWSLATVGSGLAGSFVALLAARAVLGVGEAGYGTVAPAIISDLFPRERRTRMLAYFFVAMPVGAAVGYALGGWIGAAYSWRLAFFIGGAPGLALAFLMLFAPEPRRGASEAAPVTPHQPLPIREGLRLLAPNRVFWASTAGLTAIAFAVGGLGYWVPKFLEAERGIDPGRAGFIFGAITAVAGLSGTMLGGVLGDWADRRRPGGGMWISGVAMIAAAPFMFLAATVESHPLIFGLIAVAQVGLFLNNAPINAAIVNAVPPAYRSFAIGLSNLTLHALGDAISPTAIGAVADSSSVARAIQVNAFPVVLGGLAMVWGARQAALSAAEAPAARPG